MRTSTQSSYVPLVMKTLSAYEVFVLIVQEQLDRILRFCTVLYGGLLGHDTVGAGRLTQPRWGCARACALTVRDKRASITAGLRLPLDRLRVG